MPICRHGNQLSFEVKGKRDFATSLPYDTVIRPRLKEELLDNELHLSDSDSEAVTNEVLENIPEIPCGDKTTPDIQSNNSQVDGINDFSRYSN